MPQSSKPQSSKPQSSKPQSSKPLRLGMVGGGLSSAVGRVHVSALSLERDWLLCAGCFSRSEAVNKASAQAYGLAQEKAFSSLGALLQQEAGNLDALLITTPQHLHFQHISAVLDSGLPVISEKAMVSSLSQAEGLYQRAQGEDCFLSVISNYTGYPLLRELKARIAQGFLGRLQQIQIEMPQEGFSRLDRNGAPLVPQAWRLEDAETPTVSLDLGVHLHMITSFLTGQRPLSVVGQSASFGNFEQVTDSISALASHDGGLLGAVWFTKAALGCRNGLKLRLFGDQGSAEWIQEFPDSLTMADKKGRRLILDRGSCDLLIAGDGRYGRFKAGHPTGFIEAFANYYQDLGAALREWKSAGPGRSSIAARSGVAEGGYVFFAKEALESLYFLSALEQSCRAGQWVEVKSCL